MGFRLMKDIHTTVRENLSAYVDGEADAQTAALIESHLAACGDCTWERDTLEQARRLMMQAPRVPVPRSFVLRQADVEVAVKARRSQTRRALYLRGATVLVGVLLLVVVAGDAWLRSGALATRAPEPLPLALEAPQDTESLTTETAPSALALEATPQQPPLAAPPIAAQPAPGETPADALERGKAPALGAGSQGFVPEPGEVRARWWESLVLWRVAEGALGLLFVALLAVTVSGARRIRHGT